MLCVQGSGMVRKGEITSEESLAESVTSQHFAGKEMEAFSFGKEPFSVPFNGLRPKIMPVSVGPARRLFRVTTGV